MQSLSIVLAQELGDPSILVLELSERAASHLHRRCELKSHLVHLLSAPVEPSLQAVPQRPGLLAPLALRAVRCLPRVPEGDRMLLRLHFVRISEVGEMADGEGAAREVSAPHQLLSHATFPLGLVWRRRAPPSISW
eukprot:CAMPEP_0184307420 /NCGR_PEP_ID=MMETSP1049-20130417/16182_1 /TAXON_ID=77928 /ORGANISM="Proteomonas sulcata, Strain CCMP704" /LENGTH=135 /DNA_ID=CAMNT_0026619919 /DNA_START=299 /DNA_END=703 /DNA_ORIENTATION=-